MLSHTVKAKYPDATVVYNDYDNYSERLANVSKTNKLLNDLRAIVGSFKREARLTPDLRVKVLERVKKDDDSGYVDYITLSSSLMFSMKYVLNYEQLEKEALYNNVKKNDYVVKGYLDGLEVVRADYKELFAQYKDCDNVVFLVDPPYLSTEAGTYKNYWKLGDYLDVLNVLKCNNYFYFTSNKSHILELCEWVETNTGGVNPFNGATMSTTANQMSYTASYTDIMLYK
ncbi:hypothetical protein GCM10007424_23940 [Flavobacterium suaedae]|uniref:DNA adenine methylase n=1 Tax=Flavobacterium suaedae TaxID=1767027 RepID=A0ABQ1K2P6_9FLAO|nr:DNA adenine methylase [Flavobacterium suaedae]GGB83130.1 hypothetical protein GCM10007424_23940 [Flavobacterium suaedae]